MRTNRAFPIALTVVFVLPIAAQQSPGTCTPPTSQQADSKKDDDGQQPKGFRGLLNSAKTAVKEGVSKGLGQGEGGPKIIDTMCLRNILPPQYDRYKPISQQFPHVAVTVLKSPPMWGDPAQDSTGRYANACWTLRGVVWSDEEHSKTIGPFDWCTPRDSEIQPMPTSNSLRTAVDVMSHYGTGPTRTEGPRPPDTLVPNDRETMRLAAGNTSPRSGRQAAMRDLNGESFSRFGHMFANLRYGMGSTFVEGDFRVWIVSIQ